MIILRDPIPWNCSHYFSLFKWNLLIILLTELIITCFTSHRNENPVQRICHLFSTLIQVISWFSATLNLPKHYPFAKIFILDFKSFTLYSIYLAYIGLISAYLEKDGRLNHDIVRNYNSLHFIKALISVLFFFFNILLFHLSKWLWYRIFMDHTLKREFNWKASLDIFSAECTE